MGVNQRNSIAYNPEHDDLTFNNYLCLFSIIKSKTINPNNMTTEVNRIKKCFGLIGDNGKTHKRVEKTKVATEKVKRKIYKYSDLVVTDTETGTTQEFKTTTECAEYFNITASQLNAYIRNGHKVKKRYAVKAKTGECKAVDLKIVVTHTKTGEVKEFFRAKDAANYIGTSDTNMAQLNKNNSTTRTGWKVKYIEGE